MDWTKYKNALSVPLQALLTLTLFGCGRSFAPIGRIDHIDVHDPLDHHLRTIDDAKQIGKIVAFVNEQRRGWGAWFGFNDIFGTPVPDIIADFYFGTAFMGHFGVGPGFFETQMDGDFVSKICGDDDREEYLHLLGLPTKNERNEK